MNLFASLVLTGASLAPVLFIYAVVALFEGNYFPGVALLVVGILLVVLGWALLTFVKARLEKFDNFSFDRVEVADRESIGLLAIYLLPLLRTSFSDLEFIVLVPAVGIFLAFALTGYNYHFNPLLKLLGWNFYKIGTPEGVTYILITKRDLRNCIGKITVGQLTGYTIIDLE